MTYQSGEQLASGSVPSFSAETKPRLGQSAAGGIRDILWFITHSVGCFLAGSHKSQHAASLFTVQNLALC